MPDDQPNKPEDDPSAFELRRAKWIADTRGALLRLMEKWGMKQP